VIRAGVRRALRLALRRRDRWEREVDDEIAVHLALRTEQLIAAGRTPDDARAEALRQFGSLDEARTQLLHAARRREESMRRTEMFDDLRQDLSFAARTLARQKSWTAITISTLALGIGATTAVFSVVSNLLIHAVPYPDADRVVIVQQQPTKGNNTGVGVSITPEVRIVNAWRDGAHSFDVLEPYRSMGLLLRTTADPVPVRATQILPTFTAFAGAKPLLGRVFSNAEIASTARVALLGEGIWRERYGADARVVGRTVALGDSSFVIIGVLPAAMTLPGAGRDRTDFWLPLDLREPRMNLDVVGRLRRGVTIPEATRELDALALRSGFYPPGRPAPFVTVIRRPAELVQYHDSLMLLTGAVALVLLVACANAAHLVLARGATRGRELAIRAALGAGRARLVRQLLTESLVLSFASGAAGILLGWLGLHAILALRPSAMVELGQVRLDAMTLGVAIAAALLSGVVFGTVAALQAARRSPNDTLKAGARGTSSGRGHDRFRAILVTTEMALSATLVVGAALLVRTVINLQHADLGFDPHDLYWVAVSLPKRDFDTDASRRAFFTDFSARMRRAPHVRALTLATVPPGSRAFSVGRFEIEGEAPATRGEGMSFTDVNAVDEHFFTTMGIPLVEGTVFTDTSTAAAQVIVNASFARAHWAPGQAVGQRVRVADATEDRPWSTIVGVASDAQTTGAGLVSTAPFLYTPLRGAPPRQSLMIRTDAPVDMAATVRATTKAISPSLPAPEVQSVDDYVRRSIARPRFTMTLLTAFTMLALIMAAVGLYGVMAYSVAERTREFGIRMALGAPSARIARGVELRGVALAVGGAAVGLTGAYWSTRLIASSLYGVAPLDVPSFAVGAGVLVATAVIACIVPARRALAVDPMTAIRAE
jgi:predicted permease